MIRSFCKQIAPTWRKTQLTNLAYAVHAVLERKTLTLSTLARSFPVPTERRCANPRHDLWHRLKRLRRFLANRRLSVADVAQRLTRLALSVSDEPGLRLSVLVDLTYMGPYAYLVASIPKGGRALPINWYAFRRDLSGEGERSQNQIIHDLLQQVFEWLAPGIEAVLVADREFARASLFRFCKQQQRNFVIRVDAETCIVHPLYDGALGQMGLRPGDPPRWLPGALYGRDEQEPVNILAVWRTGYDEPWFLATCLSTADAVEDIYRQRMKIEHGFRDWKHHLRLKGTLAAQNVSYVKGLLTVLAVLYWFVCLFGLHWTERKHWCRVACWGQPSFFKVALSLLEDDAALTAATWGSILAWIRDKLLVLRPFLPTYKLRYRRNRPWLQQSG
jgi:hypothetical protein